MPSHEKHKILVTGLYKSHSRASQVVERLINEDFPMDQISLLSRASGAGDDILGVSFHNTAQRMKVWGKQGAFWGAMWGLLAGMSGMFILPGLGALFAAGPIVEALAGAAAGAVVAGSTMAGAAVVSQLASALHRIGIPPENLQQIESAVANGQYLVILHCDTHNSEKYAQILAWAGAESVYQLAVNH